MCFAGSGADGDTAVGYRLHTPNFHSPNFGTPNFGTPNFGTPYFRTRCLVAQLSSCRVRL